MGVVQPDRVVRRACGSVVADVTRTRHKPPPDDSQVCGVTQMLELTTVMIELSSLAHLVIESLVVCSVIASAWDMVAFKVQLVVFP